MDCLVPALRRNEVLFPGVRRYSIKHIDHSGRPQRQVDVQMNLWTAFLAHNDASE
jgi:hypothetical protein